MNWLIGIKFSISIENKLLIYKCILKPVWTCGIELWGSASHLNIEILQHFQYKVLKILSWYITNTDVYKYLQMPIIKVTYIIKLNILQGLQRLQNRKNQPTVMLLES